MPQGSYPSRRLATALLLLLPGLPAQARPTAADSFTFVVLSDTHVGRTGDAGRLREAVQRIRELKPAPQLVVVAGDLTDRGGEAQAAEYRRIMAELPMPIFEVPGNHDESFVPTPAKLERAQRLLGKSPQPTFVTVEGRHFVGFDSVLLNTRRPPPGPNDVGFAQLDALERLLSSLPSGPVFLVHHIPPVDNFVKYRWRPTWHPAFLRRFREILERHPVTALIAGHFHRDQLHFVAGVPLLICPATSSWAGFTPSFRVVTHDQRGLRFRQIYLGPHGRGRSYVTDLRGVDEAAFHRQIMGYDTAELQHLWLRRYTGVVSVAELMGRKLTPDQLRQLMLTDPTADAGATTTQQEPALLPGARSN